MLNAATSLHEVKLIAVVGCPLTAAINRISPQSLAAGFSRIPALTRMLHLTPGPSLAMSFSVWSKVIGGNMIARKKKLPWRITSKSKTFQV